MAFIFIYFEFICYFQEVYKEQQVIFCTLSSSTVRKLSKFGWHPDIIVIGRFGKNSFFSIFVKIQTKPHSAPNQLLGPLSFTRRDAFWSATSSNYLQLSFRKRKLFFKCLISDKFHKS